jgi:REG-2-like HAD superfamily hydrolase
VPLTPRGLSLDAAGTVIGVARPVAETYCALALEHGIAIASEDLAGRFSREFSAMPPLAFQAGLARPALERAERGWWRALVTSCLGEHASHPRFGDYFDALYRHYAGATAWHLYPDVLPLLTAAREAGLAVVVTSNFDSRLTGILRELSIESLLTGVLYSSAVGSAKPDGGIFRAACERLGLPAAAVLHVGDSAVADRDGALAAGLQARWLKRNGAGGKDVVADLHAVVTMLSQGPDGSRRQT